MDEQTEKALNQEAEEINRAADSLPAEQTTEEVAQEQAEVATETETEVTETGESKKNAQARIRELDARAKQAEQKAASLAEKLAALTGSGEPRVDLPPFNPSEPIVAEGEEISVAELNRRQAEREQKLLRQTEALITLKQKQNDIVNRINSEAIEVMRDFPQLDPDSEYFDKELSETIAEAVEAKLKADPYNTSVKAFTAKLMRPYKGAVEKEVSQVTENLAKQVSETALRPTSIKVNSEKPDSQLSIAELEAKYGIETH